MSICLEGLKARVIGVILLPQSRSNDLVYHHFVACIQVHQDLMNGRLVTCLRRSKNTSIVRQNKCILSYRF